MEISVVTNAKIIAKIENVLLTCADWTMGQIPLILYDTSLSDFLSERVMKIEFDGKIGRDAGNLLFDFVEYSGGLSSDPAYKEHLKMMAKVSNVPQYSNLT